MFIFTVEPPTNTFSNPHDLESWDKRAGDELSGDFILIPNLPVPSPWVSELMNFSESQCPHLHMEICTPLEDNKCSDQKKQWQTILHSTNGRYEKIIL